MSATADMLSEELAGYSLQTIQCAMREHARRSRFFPTLHEILQLCEHTSRSLEYQRQITIGKLPCPTELSDEQVALNKAKISSLRDHLARKMRMT